ncbi:hypothetical protein ABZV75_38380 [Streptomyces flaveolus]|uniref:hypothetical protein n=1 Tax=Streptomyces flaveolus TaxID=67297 RepID=UPI0033BEB557
MKAVTEAQKAYDEAVAAETEGRKEVEATLKALESDTHPLKAAAIAADKAGKEAGATKDAAVKVVADAKAKLDAAQSDSDKAEAQRVLAAASSGPGGGDHGPAGGRRGG